MNYVINREIVFSPEKKTLLLVEESEVSITLSNQATRLLVELIKGNKKPLAKEKLLKNVWEDYGLTPSNNNLYMAVSEIRKSFVSMGINEVFISTIPKTGFLFSASIDILESETVKNTNDNKKKHSKSKIKKTALLLLLVIIPTFIYMYYKQNDFNNALTTAKIPSAEKYEKCTFYSLNENSEKHLSKIIDNLKKINGNLECNIRNKNIFYQTDNSYFTFIASCEGDKNNLNECESYRITTGI